MHPIRDNADMTTPAPTRYFIGLMSGTSLDGVDGVLCQINDHGDVQVVQHVHEAFHPRTREVAYTLNQAGHNELHLAAQLGTQLAHDYSAVCRRLFQAHDLSASAVCAIGAHGQTVRHQPEAASTLAGDASVGYSVQANHPALLAEHTGIDVIADFRARDLAAGGQGAPLVPAFHRGVFGRAGVDVAVLNIGGIANASVLAGNGGLAGCDTGPGNVLLDLWAQQHLGTLFDTDGAWGGSGRVAPALLAHFLSDPFFQHNQARQPSSTGRDDFNATWLHKTLTAFPAVEALEAVDVQATLGALTAQSAATQVRHLLQHLHTTSTEPAQLLVCGGGAYNQQLMQLLQQALPQTHVTTTDTVGLPVLQVEAAAFAWLAWCFVTHRSGNAIQATGAKGPRILGALYPK